LLLWTLKAAPEPGLYRAGDGIWTLNPFSRPACALLVSVAVARSLGGWNPLLPARQVFADFEERLKAQGGTVGKDLKIRQIQSKAGTSGLWTSIRRHVFGAGTKSR